MPVSKLYWPNLLKKPTNWWLGNATAFIYWSFVCSIVYAQLLTKHTKEAAG